MMASDKKNAIVHRPGPLKQSNKSHKGGRNTDKKHSKGKVDVKKLSQHKKQDLRRNERKNRLQQLRKTKREEVIMQKRGLGGANSAPLLVVILSLDDCIDAEKFLFELQSCDDEIVVTRNNLGGCHVYFPRQKQRFTFIMPSRHNLHIVMDSLKVADVLILLHPLQSADDFNDFLLSVIISHALPTTVHVVQGMDEMNPKKKAEYRKSILKNIETRFPDDKLHAADTRQEMQLLLRHIGCQKRRPVGFRDSRFYLLAENVDYAPSETDSECGTLKVSGFVRGQPLSVNGLVHIPGWGDYQMSQIDYETDPYPALNKTPRHKSSADNNEDMSLDHAVLCDKADPTEQETLESTVEPDPMEGEQTFPTEEEIREADLEPKKKVKKVVEGTSDYQAAWIVDSEDSDGSDDSEEESVETESMFEEAVESMSEKGSHMDEDMESTDENYDKNIDFKEERETMVRFKEERMNEMFPDELDTPVDKARERLARYRGLKNFRSSPWDPMEELPQEYAEIYRFGNFKQTKKKVLNAEKEGAIPGSYITMHIKNVEKSVYDSIDDSVPFVVYGLLKHEQKLSVMNVVIQKHRTCQSSIKSKDDLTFHIGYRRFTCKPIFSEHKTGNKFKYERFLPRDTAVVASFYAPVMFPPASVVVFKELKDGSQELVATGSVLDMNPNRVIIKRIVLSGHPFKIFTRTVVVRYMFFNNEDIKYFKCVELHTKCGRRGHIRESLGTQGHMKCTFDKQLQSQDVVLMNLYKRTFPKWEDNPFVLKSKEKSAQDKAGCVEMT